MKLTLKHVKREGNGISLFFTGDDNKNYKAITVLNLAYPKKLKFLNTEDCEWINDNGIEFIKFYREILGKRIAIRRVTLLRNLMEINEIPGFDKRIDFIVGKFLMKFNNLVDIGKVDYREEQ